MGRRSAQIGKAIEEWIPSTVYPSLGALATWLAACELARAAPMWKKFSLHP